MYQYMKEYEVTFNMYDCSHEDGWPGCWNSALEYKSGQHWCMGALSCSKTP